MNSKPIIPARPTVEISGAWLMLRLDCLGTAQHFALTPHAAVELLRTLHQEVPGFIRSLNEATVIKFPKAKKRRQATRAKLRAVQS